MAHITSIGAGIYSALAVNTTAITSTTAVDTLAELVALFADDTAFKEVKNVREFPQIGTPANIVNVPVYGSKTSQQIQGQSDAPNLEVTINYIPSEWDPTVVGGLGAKVGDGKQYAFQFSLLNSKPASLETTSTGLGATANSNFYFVGKLEALLVSPQLTDANQATLTLSIQSEFFGPATVAPV
jgi:hypothetical protein